MTDRPHVCTNRFPEAVPRITTAPDRPDEALLHLPEFTYWDTQAWSAEVGIPAEHLPALRDAIDAHLKGADVTEGGDR